MGQMGTLTKKSAVNPKYSIKSLKKALNILKLFDLENQELSLTDISLRMGMNKSSTIRFVNTLVEEEFLKIDEYKKYRLGIWLFQLGSYMYESLNLRKIAKPLLDEVAKKTGFIVHLGVLEHTNVVILEKIWPPKRFDSIQMVSRPGGIVPAHCTGVGKVLLAFEDEKRVRDLVSKMVMTKYTDKTITDPEDFLVELRKVRKNGYAINDGEHEPYIKCLTYPILDHTRKVVAAVSLTALKEEFNDRSAETLHESLRATTSEISRHLGYNP